jgi:drug/metabolite transporter (DMT)-like permease
MIAVLAGLGAAVAFAVSTLAATRSTRLIGASSTVAGVVAVGLPLAAALALVDRSGVTMSVAPLLAISGIGNVVGLGLAYAALRHGRVGVIAPLVSTEGAVAALIAILAGARAEPVLVIALAIVAFGGALTAASAQPGVQDAALTAAPDRMTPATSALLACAAAVSFGVSLYATGRIGQELPFGWAALAPRVAGTMLVTLPLAATSRLRLNRRALAMVGIAGVAEVVGYVCVGLGARSNLAVTAVLASQFAALAVIGAVLLFGERLRRVQQLGVVAIAIGTALVAVVGT